MNRVVLIGHLVSELEVRERVSGDRTARFSVGTIPEVDQSCFSPPCEQLERNNILVTDQAIVDFAENSLRKGSLVRIEGSLMTRYWVDERNIERYATEVVVGHTSGRLRLLSEQQMADSIRPEGAKSSKQSNRKLEKFEP